MCGSASAMGTKALIFQDFTYKSFNPNTLRSIEVPNGASVQWTEYFARMVSLKNHPNSRSRTLAAVVTI
jgi:hypothetical protein